ncbi:MAG: hypothetical protein K6F86_06835 [Lachnospiraceae bacterium]|nr:hypothetical protein [Lachnospiraceae bacterium]
MDEKKKILNDDALDNVSGGAIYKLESGEWIAVDEKTGKNLGGGSRAGAEAVAFFAGEDPNWVLTDQEYYDVTHGKPLK